MQLASMRGLRAFHLRGHVLEPHIGDVFAALPDSVREARFVVVGVSQAYAEGSLNSFHEFASAFKDELARRGANRSLIHIDWMIGSAEVDVDGVDADGGAEPLMRRGEWV